MRYYYVTALLIDDFEDTYPEESELPLKDIETQLIHLPAGFKSSNVEIKKLTQEEYVKYLREKVNEKETSIHASDVIEKEH